MIRQIHHDGGQRYGSRVHATLRTQGSGACRGRIERLMCRSGIRAIMAPLVGLADSRPNLPVPNLNARAFTAAAPGSPVSTTFQLRGWLYVAAIMASSAAK
ncbi:MAG TPA: IS3 family transposase [Candidatus Binatia bacterium]|nr:IS3 family transposase [Candidatus Binatia bacterium]